MSESRAWFTFLRRPAIYVPVLAVLAAGAASIAVVRQALDASRELRATDAMLLNSERLLTRLIDSETGERGYLLTGQEQFLEPFHASVRSVDSLLATLRGLADAHPAQQRRLDTLTTLRVERLALLNAAIELRRTAGLEAAAQTIAMGREKAYTDALRALIDSIQQRERERREVRLLRVRRTAVLAFWTIGIGFVLALGVAVAFNTIFTRTVEARRRAIAEVDLQASELDDVTRSVVAGEEALWRHQEFLRATLESMQDGVIAANVAGEIAFMNSAVRGMLPPAARVNQRAADVWASESGLVHPDGTPLAGEEVPLARALRGETIADVEVHSMRPDRSKRLIRASAQPIRDARGGIIGGVVVMHDETRSRGVADALSRTEAQLRQAQKLEAIGQLAGGVAHDFNNILTAILGTADIALMHKELPAELRTDLQDIRDAALHAASVTRQLLMMSRKQVLQVEPVAINGILARVRPLLRRMLNEDITLDVDARATGTVMADATQLEQVLVNLALNAGDAMSGGGDLHIVAHDQSVVAPLVIETGELPAGLYNVVEVRDTGRGMPSEVVQHIFEPFFTTKGPQRGTGLGLATVYGIVTQSGGQIAVRSEVGRGTTFLVYLPRTEVPASALAPREDESGEDLRGNETILLVEDEASVRAPIARALRNLGYFVLEAKHGEDALTVLREFEAPAHLVITDLVMPEMGGARLMEALQAWYPNLRIIFVSGYSEELLLAKGVLVPGARYLAKPFSMHAIAKLVRESLDEPAR